MCHRKYPFFISRGFRNRKKAGERFLEHETCDCHKDYKKLLDMENDEANVGEKTSDSLVNEKAKNQQMFLTILQKIQCLAKKGLVSLGNEGERNFDQLMKLSSKIDPKINSWIEKKKKKKKKTLQVFA